MKVSVLVTFYNQEDYVDEALQSVFDQKCDFDFEVLIGDDGSTDGTMAKLQQAGNDELGKRKEITGMEAEISGQNGNLCDGPGTWCEIQQQSAGIKKPSESFAVCKGRVFCLSRWG